VRRLLYEIINTVKFLFGFNRKQRELDEEIEFHIREAVEERIQAGVDPKEARLQVLREFGNTNSVLEDCRDSWGMNMATNFWRDVRFALRGILKNKVFVLAIFSALGLCVGANTAVFSVLNSLIYKTLPFDRSERLVEIYHVRDKAFPDGRLSSNPSTFIQYSEEASSFSDISIHTTQWSTVMYDGEAVRLEGVAVASKFFDTLGVKPVLGSLIRGDDFSSIQKNVVVVSEPFWRDALGGSVSVLGELLQIDKVDYQIVGVISGEIQALFPQAAFFIPWNVSLEQISPNDYAARQEAYATMWARLAPGASAESATAELAFLDDQFYAQAGDAANKDRRMEGFVTRMKGVREIQTEWIRSKLYLLQGVSGLILIIGLVNVANMLLAHSNGRLRELGVRGALGASRRRLLGQCSVEVGMLALGGWIAGILMASFGLRLLKGYAPEIANYGSMVQLDGYAVMFSCVLSAVSGAVMLLVVSSRLIASKSAQGSFATHQQSMSKASRRTASALVSCQIAMSFVLLIGAGLLAKSFWAVMNQDLGFEPRGVVTARISLPESTHPEGKGAERFRERLLDRLKEFPTVVSAAFSTQVPTFGYPFTVVSTPQTLRTDWWENPEAAFTFVSEDYFKTLGLSVVSGRSFEATDSAYWQEGILVDSSFVLRSIPEGQDPLGSYLKPGKAPQDPKNWGRIIGVVENSRHENLDVDYQEPLIYRPLRGAGHREFSLFVDSSLSYDQAIPEIRRAILEIDPMLPVFRIGSLEGFMGVSLESRKGLLSLVAAYALAGLLLTFIGIFGLLAYDVSTHVKEIGIRRSIGANRFQILWQVLGKGLRHAAIGLLVGGVGAASISELLQKFLYSTEPLETSVYVLVSLLLLIAIVAASYLPALRATRIDPSMALRVE